MSFIVCYEKTGNLFAWNLKYTLKRMFQCMPLTYVIFTGSTPNVLQSKDESVILGRRFAFPRRNQHYARPDAKSHLHYRETINGSKGQINGICACSEIKRRQIIRTQIHRRASCIPVLFLTRVASVAQCWQMLPGDEFAADAFYRQIVPRLRLLVLRRRSGSPGTTDRRLIHFPRPYFPQPGYLASSANINHSVPQTSSDVSERKIPMSIYMYTLERCDCYTHLTTTRQNPRISRAPRNASHLNFPPTSGMTATASFT